METFNLTYSVEGILSMVPLHIKVKAENLEEAKISAKQKLEEKFEYQGRKITIY